MNTYTLVKPIMKAMTMWHRLLFKSFCGSSLGTFKGNPICMITTIGRKSGNPVTIPLLTIPHQDDYILVASQGGAPTHPAWYYNIVDEPRIKMTLQSKTYDMLAKQLSDKEKEDLWPVIVNACSVYDDYRQRTSRNIPVFLCSKQ